MSERKKAYLLLENGKVFTADLFGYEDFDIVFSQIVFTTSMVGYLETLTDARNLGQAVIQTFPLIGNYGIIPKDFERNTPCLNAYIAREFCDLPSNFRSQYNIEKYLIDNKIPALCNIDTRAITKQIRDNGVMNVAILKDFDEGKKNDIITRLKDYRIENAVQQVSTKEEKYFCLMRPYRVVILDFGCPKSLIDSFIEQDCDVVVVPYDTSAEKIKKLNPDGIVLSPGPGNPSDNLDIIKNIEAVQRLNIPMLAIGLGHQMLALANGAKTNALKYGHRGASQPVRDLNTGRVYVTSQNHGYVVDNDSLQDNMKLRFVNINDKSCEGIEYTDKPCLSIQFDLMLCAGATDSAMLLDEFILMVKESKTDASK